MRMTQLYRRAALSKALGLLVGLGAFWLHTRLSPDSGLGLRLGLVVLYLTLGGIVGIVGFVNRVPVFGLPFRPLWRGAAMGAWMGLLGALFGGPELGALIAAVPLMPAILASPFWLVIEAALVGALLDVVVSRATGPMVWPEQGFGAAD